LTGQITMFVAIGSWQAVLLARLGRSDGRSAATSDGWCHAWRAGMRVAMDVAGRAPLRPAGDARRFTVSPAWFGVTAARQRSPRSASTTSAPMTSPDPAAAEMAWTSAVDTIGSAPTETDPTANLAAAGIATAHRGGHARLFNTTHDADRFASVLRPHTNR